MHPPKLPLRFFRWYCHPRIQSYIEGDLEEVYRRRLGKRGKLNADIRFLVDVLLLLRPGIVRPLEGVKILNNYGMYKNYVKIGWRSLLRSKGYSIINISGLAMGMAVALLIGLWVHNELSYNKSFDNYSRIGMLYHNISLGDRIMTYEGTPYVLGKELKNNFADFEDVTSYFGPHEHILSVDDKKFTRTCYFIEPNFAKMFSIKMIQGVAFKPGDVNSVMVARSLADALVGKDAIGKLVKIDNRDNLVITGVFEDFPSNSHLADVKALAPVEYYFGLNDTHRNQKESWGDLEAGCFVLLNEKASWAATENKIKNFFLEKTSEELKGMKPQALIHPMAQWHLYGDFKDGINTGGKIRYVWMFGTVGTFVLLLACINFMNLSTARSERRSKEVGIRKVMGSLRNQLVSQFMSESLLVVMIAFVLALGLVFTVLPAFNMIAETQIQIPWTNVYFFGTAFAFILTTGLLAGSYPALYLSSFNPVSVLKGTFKAGRHASLPRKILVVFQFTISTVLIIGTGIVFQQIQHAKNRPIGFDTDGLIFAAVRSDDLIKANYNSVRNDLLATGVVENVAKSDFPITGGMAAEANIYWQGKDEGQEPLIAFNQCSHDFPSTSGFQFVEGRDFSREFLTDSLAMIVNEMGAELFAPGESAIGKTVQWGGKNRHIVGVIKDQIRWTPFEKQSAHVYYVRYPPRGFYTVRIKSDENAHEALIKIESVFRKYDPGTPFDYKFVDDDYARLFKTEERIGKLAGTFSGLAIVISCIGIFGLASFAASQRTKEIGIRKVLGASVFRVWKLLSKEFAWLMGIAVFVAFPVAFYFANDWLQQYEYRITISWPIFLLTGASLFLITLLTVSYQSIRAAVANPVDSLRSE